MATTLQQLLSHCASGDNFATTAQLLLRRMTELPPISLSSRFQRRAFLLMAYAGLRADELRALENRNVRLTPARPVRNRRESSRTDDCA